MGFFSSRITAYLTYLVELARYGMRATDGPLDREVVFVLDGVGGFQMTPLLVRRAFRGLEHAPGVVPFRWQFGLPGEIWTDLMWLRRNRVMGVKLARRLLAYHRARPATRLHVVGFSGGAGIAVFAAEALHKHRVIDTLVLIGAPLSPRYDLSRSLQAVERCYALVSRRDTGILGLGTRVFGTIDRNFTTAAGAVGFRTPPNAAGHGTRNYSRLREIHWSPALKALGHRGGHLGWLDLRFLRRHLLPILRGEPLLPIHEVLPG